jgi:hypothetical protein
MLRPLQRLLETIYDASVRRGLPLRRFYRMGCQRKLRHIEALA